MEPEVGVAGIETAAEAAVTAAAVIRVLFITLSPTAVGHSLVTEGLREP